MGETKTLSTKVDTDSDVYEQLDEYQEGELSTSETVRALMRSGLENEGYLDTPADDEPEPTGFAVRAFDFAQTAFQVSILSLATALLAFVFAPSFVGLLGLFTAATGLTSILATLLAAVAARVEIGEAALTDRILDREVETDSGNGSEPPAEPAGGD